MGYDYDTLPDSMKKKTDYEPESSKDRKGSSRNDFEHELQKRAMKFVNLQYPELNRRLFAIPNGGARNAITGAKLKTEGVLAGVWDLFLAVPRGDYGGCFIETKWGKNRLSDTQKKFREANKEVYYFFVYRSLDEFADNINEYLTQK